MSTRWLSETEARARGAGRSRTPSSRRTGLRSESGLTLIELMVVLVILGLFASIAYQAFFPQVDKAKIQTARTQMDILSLALDNYRLDVGEYPAALQDLIQSSSPKWKGPYLAKNKIPKDPWDNEYAYQVQDGGTHFELYSTGDGTKEIRYDEGE